MYYRAPKGNGGVFLVLPILPQEAMKERPRKTIELEGLTIVGLLHDKICRHKRYVSLGSTHARVSFA